jgi:NAD(P)-dependent dehydrogenase (short-subunit alcohol dehydrogenase family)
VALVTGASRGLGRALALALAPTHHVVAVARTVGALEELDDAIRAAGGQATLAPLDVTEPEAMRALASALAARWGRLDLWVHAAVHAGPLAPAGHLAPKDLDRSISVNLRATASLIGLLAPSLGTAGAPCSSTTRAGASASSAITAPPRPGRWRWRAPGRPRARASGRAS